MALGELADRVAADFGDRFRSFGDRAPGRFVAEIAGLTVVSVGVDQPWGVQIVAMDDAVDAEAVAAAVVWCRAGGYEPQVRVRAADRGALPAYAVVEEVPALVAPAGGEQSVVDIVRATDLEEFRDVYTRSFGMPPGLAAGLVVAADLDAHPHLLGRVDGRDVGCAQLRPGSDLAYVSGVGVLPAERGRGYGKALLVACRTEAAARGCELVWLNASSTSVGFYEAIGFELVDVHLALAAS
jgi:ribosomal protein S18 acetylase RimI-like enzyme